MKGFAFHYEPMHREFWFDLLFNFEDLEIYEIGTPEDELQKNLIHVPTLADVPSPKILFQPQDAHEIKPEFNYYEHQLPDDAIWCFGPDNGYLTEWDGGDVVYLPMRHNTYSFQAAMAALTYGYR